jgi:hypothetical protein
MESNEKLTMCSIERREQLIVGWKNADEVAASVWSSIHSKLVEGTLVFAYKSTNDKIDLVQLVVVRNLRRDAFGNPTGLDNSYAVGMVTKGFTMLLPNVPLTYVENDVINDMKKYKLEKDLMDLYKQVIKNFEEKYGSK